jgi:hypothetical protein
MPRCSLPPMFTWALALPLMASIVLPLSAQAQTTPRVVTTRPVPIPSNTLRGAMLFGMPPEVKLNDKATRLSPATRIRGQSNTLVMSATLAGQTWAVNYTLDKLTGMVLDVWLLTPEEATRRWPTTSEESTRWVFDPISQSWLKP